MIPAERAIAAFNLKSPDDIVPTFELQFQLSEELLGKKHLFDGDFESASTASEKDMLIKKNAELYIEEAETLDYSIISVTYGPVKDEFIRPTFKHIKKIIGDKYLIAMIGDPTMAIPNGENMMQLVQDLAEKPDEMHNAYKNNVADFVERAKRYKDAGVDVCLMCSDYCLNTGPFLSPTMFREWVTPYLSESISELKKIGMWAIKHTDGNIMPIIDQLIEAQPHALHSIDPQAGVDLKEVKQLTKGKLALCGNVHCGMLHNGTKEQVIEDSKRSLAEGMLDGGFFFCTSNTPFKGMPLENYLAMLDVRKECGRYDF
ncbi:MAG: uroporphyrinogen decarboxylase family protein [Armatimonadota bacterium]